MAIDLSTPTGQVRLLIPDRKEGKQLFSDVEIECFLSLEGNVVKRTAALALETMATDVAMTLKYIETNSLKVDGSKPAQVCLSRAKMLREQSAPEPEVTNEDDWEFNHGCDDGPGGGLGLGYGRFATGFLPGFGLGPVI